MGYLRKTTCWPIQNGFQHRWSHRIACWVNNDKTSHPARHCWKTRHKRLCSTLKGLLISQQLSLGTAAPSFLGNFCCSVAKSCSTVCDPWTAVGQASLSFSISQSLLRFMSIELVMLSNHLILCWPLLLLPSVFPSIRVFSSELALHIKWPKYWSFSFSISSFNELQGWFPLGLTGFLSFQCKGLSTAYIVSLNGVGFLLNMQILIQ